MVRCRRSSSVRRRRVPLSVGGQPPARSRRGSHTSASLSDPTHQRRMPRVAGITTPNEWARNPRGGRALHRSWGSLHALTCLYRGTRVFTVTPAVAGPAGRDLGRGPRCVPRRRRQGARPWRFHPWRFRRWRFRRVVVPLCGLVGRAGRALGAPLALLGRCCATGGLRRVRRSVPSAAVPCGPATSRGRGRGRHLVVGGQPGGPRGRPRWWCPSGSWPPCRAPGRVCLAWSQPGRG